MRLFIMFHGFDRQETDLLIDQLYTLEPDDLSTCNIVEDVTADLPVWDGFSTDMTTVFGSECWLNAVDKILGEEDSFVFVPDVPFTKEVLDSKHKIAVIHKDEIERQQTVGEIRIGDADLANPAVLEEVCCNILEHLVEYAKFTFTPEETEDK